MIRLKFYRDDTAIFGGFFMVKNFLRVKIGEFIYLNRGVPSYSFKANQSTIKLRN